MTRQEKLNNDVEKAKAILKEEAERARKLLMEEALLRTYDNKPIIETIINTSALALTSYGIAIILQGELIGYISLFVGMCLEFIKYYGRKKKYW